MEVDITEIQKDFQDIQIELDNTTVLENLLYLTKKIENYSSLKDYYLQQINDIDLEIDKNQEYLNVIQESKVYYLKAIDLIYENSIGELERIVNLALSYIFYDTNYKLKVELEDKRGKSLYFYIQDSKGNLVSVDDVGRGIRTVVSFIIHIFYLINKGSIPFLFLDEHFSAISLQYADRFFSFVKSLCDNKGLVLVLITHDLRFLPYCDKLYLVNEGKVVLQDKNKVSGNI